MTVESWDPSATTLTSSHRAILNHAASQLETDVFSLTDDEQALLRPTMHVDSDAWWSFSATESDATIEAWIKVLTLVERDFNGFEAGSRSPVLTLIKVLRTRNALSGNLFVWIKSHTENRFLPYGSLSDRL
ncbi:MAG: hypothetical protein OXG05_03185 [Gammaproteobacteria bacterium]|nr:hypothetical protein [Gammaproteobacteria bacterium]